MSDDLIEQKLVPDCMSDEGARPCKGYANLMKAAIQTRTRLESENTYLRKIADMAARTRDEALEALEKAEADALEKAVEIANDIAVAYASADTEAGQERFETADEIAGRIRALKPKAKA